MTALLEQPVKTSTKPHILFHRSNPWDSPVQGSTKTYARLFQQAGHPVTYLQDLAHSGHWLLRRGYFNTWKKGSYWSKGVWVSSGLSIFPSMLQLGIYNPKLVELSYRSCVPSIHHQIRQSCFSSPDVIWSTIPGSGVLKKLFPHAKLIMNVVDFYPAFHGKNIQKLEAYDYSVADHIFVTAHTLKKYLIETFSVPAKKIMVLGQGVDVERYARTYERPTDLPNCEGPIAICVGVLQKADVEFLERLAVEVEQRSGCLVLIGPSADWDRDALQKQCVVRLGPRRSEDVPAYLSYSDIGVMLYDRSRASVYRGLNPLKLYEYLAAGLSVLSTPHDEYEYIEPPVMILRSPEEVPKALTESLSTREIMSNRARRFVENYTWQSCVDKASSQISILLEKGMLSDS